MRIDAHHHIWKLDKFDYVWMSSDLAALQHDFGPQELEPLLQQHAIDATILVQTISSIDETRWFLELAKTHAFIAGVVGWVDLTANDVDQQLADLCATSNRLVGIRHQVHDEPDDAWLARTDVCHGLAAVAKHGLAYDLLIRPHHLDVSLQVVRQFENLRFVIDHMAKPDIAGGSGFSHWADGMRALADCPNVSCKLSGMITEADWSTWKPDDLKRYLDLVLDVFGTRRVVFGSDWPVCLLAGNYGAVVDALEQHIATLTANEQACIFGKNAIDIYQMEFPS